MWQDIFCDSCISNSPDKKKVVKQICFNDSIFCHDMLFFFYSDASSV